MTTELRYRGCQILKWTAYGTTGLRNYGATELRYKGCFYVLLHPSPAGLDDLPCVHQNLWKLQDYFQQWKSYEDLMQNQ